MGSWLCGCRETWSEAVEERVGPLEDDVRLDGVSDCVTGPPKIAVFGSQDSRLLLRLELPPSNEHTCILRLVRECRSIRESYSGRNIA